MYIPLETKRRAAPPMGELKMENFFGCDLTNDPSNVDPRRSPECPNMIRTTTGKVGKRPGYHTVKTYEGKINGVHFLYGETDKKLLHEGTNLWLVGEEDTLLYDKMADSISISHQLSGMLVIQDGITMIIYDGTDAKPVSEVAYVPTIIIGGRPTGGGVVLENRNVVQPRVKYRAAGTATDKVFQLPDREIDEATVEVKKLKSDSTFDTLTENTDFTVNRTTGQVTFTDVSGVSPVTGEDNIRITYSKTIEGNADRINKTDMSILYGLNSARDRLFVAGSSPNIDYYCQINDPTYWGEYWFSVIGQDGSPIVGYSIINDRLATHKRNAEKDTNIILRKGTMLNNEAAFILDGSYQGSGAIAKHGFGNLENEPLFITEDKTINAVTPSDVLGERYSQARSYYLNKALQKEPNLDKAFAHTWNQFYLLAVGERIYILDGTQFFTEKNTPFSHRQYAAFYWTNINARAIWSEGDKLYFGTVDGAVNEFYDGTLSSHYNDNGEPITCYWDTVMDTGENFAMKKTYTYIAVRLGAFVRTGVRIHGLIRGIWRLLQDYTADANYFDFDDFDFGDFTFNTDATPQVVGKKIKIKNVDKTQFRFENSRLNEPFELYEAYVEFVQSHYYRK